MNVMCLLLCRLFLGLCLFADTQNLLPKDLPLVRREPFNILVQRPNSFSESWEGEPKVEYQINSWGYRDVEFEITSERPLILVVGDSHTFGVGIAADQRWPSIIQSQLDQVDVYNLSQQGGSLELQVILLLAELERLKQRQVVQILIEVPKLLKELPLLHSHMWGTPKPRYMQIEGVWQFVSAPANELLPWSTRLGFRPTGLACCHGWRDQWVTEAQRSWERARDVILRSYYRIRLYRTWVELFRRIKIIGQEKNIPITLLLREKESREIAQSLGLDYIDVAAFTGGAYHVNDLVKHTNFLGNQKKAELVLCHVFKSCP
jgi:hypothetical protein